MRRFSQRHSLVTLSDINITPLLDLAFVLLIIFIIISPSIRSSREHGMELNLPPGGGPHSKLERKDIRTVEINRQGGYMLDAKPMPLDQIEKSLVQTHRSNPKLIVYVRADKKGLTEHLYAVIDRCTRNGILNISLETEPKAN